MKGHWLLRHVPLEKKCGFTLLLLLRLDQCEDYLCISSFSGKRTDKSFLACSDLIPDINYGVLEFESLN